MSETFKGWLDVYNNEYSTNSMFRRNPTEMQAMVSFMEKKTCSKVAARDYTWSYITHREKSLAMHLYVLTSAAVETFDLAEQEQLTNLLSAISRQEYAETVGKGRSGRYPMTVGKFPSSNLLDGLGTDLGESYKSLFVDSYTEGLTEEHRLWINLNVFMARLTSRHIYDFRSTAHQQFDFFLAPDDPKIRTTPSLYSLAVSAAAQHLIYAGVEIYNTMVDSFGEPLGKWNALKEQFLAAEKDKAVTTKASEQARLAVESMAVAEKKWRRMQKKATKVKQVELADGRIKRSHDVAFADA